MKGVNETLLADQSHKPRKPKSREVNSRFLSPSSTPSRDMGMPSPNQVLSPGKPSTPPDNRKHRSLDQDGGFIRGLWPSSATTFQSSSNKNFSTLAEQLGNERLRDNLDRKTNEKTKHSSVFSLGRQRSCSEFSRFENGKEKEKEKEKGSAKENHRPLLAGSMRYTRNLKFPGKCSSLSSSTNSLSNNSGMVPGRMSVDENTLYRKSHGRRSDPFMDNLESLSKCSDTCSATDISSPGMGKDSSHSRKSGIDVSSKYLQDVRYRPRRLNSDSNIQNPVSFDSSPRLKKFTLKNAIKRANSLTGYGSATSQWALSPGRSGSPPMSVESKQRPMSFSSLKPPCSSSKATGMEKLLNMGLDLFKSKKTSSSPQGSGDVETVHQLRMLQNRLMQWRYANARADAAKEDMNNQVKNNLLCAWYTVAKLEHSVLQKKLRLQKEKLKMKLDLILMSQIKPLESWGDIERQHLSAVSMMKECLHSVVCKIPLTEGAKVDPQSASMAIRHALDLAASIKSILAHCSPSAGKTILLLSELADAVAQERLLMEECIELSRSIALLEMEERSLKCYIIQLKSCQHLQQQQQEEEGTPL